MRKKQRKKRKKRNSESSNLSQLDCSQTKIETESMSETTKCR